MADITKCINESCPLKEYCYRWTASASKYQSYAEFKPKIYKFEHKEDSSKDIVFAECEYFIRNVGYIPDLEEIKKFIEEETKKGKVERYNGMYIYFADPRLLKYFNDKVIEHFIKQPKKTKAMEEYVVYRTYVPLLDGISYEEVKQIAKELRKKGYYAKIKREKVGMLYGYTIYIKEKPKNKSKNE